ncbi:hypothetical protein TWF102_006671 [Orbilia oligospora]|uniref:F-box domain-containing protein n=1 Tax=Orbilia oligospora TaxID=2813651 RepID=A0A7C8NNB6_ORBOL|nr:hypothetical protein TWF706_008839 [Orbilia oligospora]KAF3096400.1 hypothetical protein TWF102_006671 [Orbilia oligospora]KAF3149283.1 hypothetical protein TWF594_011328 [Orbilia oligospora]KAF3181436.1 hypothetical protein TWF751_009374 [Orbilia oligospora]KAF3292472.1 hypothetical protein TWF132_005525 [Orbilia oligospora]
MAPRPSMSIFRGNGPRKSFAPTTPSVFLIPEILELIMLELPAITVLTTCRGVCKSWKSLIEMAPDLKYYSLTGLKRSKKRQAENAARQLPDQIITPMALAVLSAFWKKLAVNGINDNLYVVNERPAVYANNRGRHPCYPVFWVLTLPIQGGTKLIPLIDPDLDRKMILDVAIEERSNWGYIYRKDGVQPEEMPKLDPSDIITEPWSKVMSALAKTVYEQAPNPTGGENPRFWCDFVYEYLDGKREKKHHTEEVVFGSLKVFNYHVAVGES